MPYTKIIQSGNELEVYEYEKEPFKRQPKKNKKRQSYSKLNLRRRGDLQRTKIKFMRLVRMNLIRKGAPAFITLTMFQNLGVKEAWRAFRRFTLNLKYLTKEPVSYIAVLEFQKRGAPHFHVLLWGLPDDVVLNEIPWDVWQVMRKKIKNRFLTWCARKNFDPESARGDRAIQHIWLRGFVDCVPSDGHPKLGTYISKYLVKAMNDERLKGFRTYSTSRNLVRPEIHKITQTFDDVSPYYLEGFSGQTAWDKSFNTEWMGRGRYRSYKLDQNPPNEKGEV